VTADYPLADAFGGLIWLAVIAALYFAPTLIAHERKVPNFGSIAVINIFLGWTLVGWVVALAMAFRSVPRDAASEVGFRNCPSCHRSISREARICPHCQTESEPWIRHAGYWWVGPGKSGKWQWHDEKQKVWRWYDTGIQSSPTAKDLTPSREVDPAVIAPPGGEARGTAVSVGQEAGTPSAELERLADLHARGVLTDDEFQQAKRRVLEP
jgi:hypothetical protein